ncbi:MAG: tetratricopeptide repeat protein [Gemmatimonadaceae bacterium]
MIQHQVYFDTLGSMKEGTPSWRSVFAGLSVLRFVDAYAAAGSPSARPGWTQLHSVRVAIEEMSEGDVIRGVLTSVIDDLTARGYVDDAVCTSLVAYGRALDYEASWGLATDVFTTVAKMVKPERNARLAVEAHVAAGGAARRNGEWEISARAYSQAAFIADTLGDRPGVLTVQIGIANTYQAKGNLPQAQLILDDVIVQARDQDLPEIQADALHGRAALVARLGNPAEGLKLAHEALELMTKPGSRDVVLADIAGMFTELGLHDAARDAHMVLIATAQSKVVRWSATLNLMELASLDGMEEAFDKYALELAKTPLGPWLRSHYLLFLGEGFQRFGREPAAADALEEAARFAEANQIHQMAFKAEAALAQSRSLPTRKSTFSVPSPWVPDDIDCVVRAIADLRKAVLAAT